MHLPHSRSSLSLGERLRLDMQAKFGGRFTVDRRILVIDCVIE